MAKVLHTCTGCVPIDVSIIDTYVALVKMASGQAGPQGPPGPAGKSAYQVALDNGYVGTQEEWLETLVGPQGDPGPQGIQGQQGPQGNAGATGAKGDTGLTGSRGLPGPAGVSSVNVNVYNTSGTPSGSATVNDGVLSLSLSGIKGEQGNTGSSVDYPYELVNNRITNDATKGLSAAEGKRIGDDLYNIEEDVRGGSVSKLLTWMDGFIGTGGGIYDETYKNTKFTQPFTLRRGERLMLTTRSSGIATFSTTSQETIDYGGEYLTVLRLIQPGDEQEVSLNYLAEQDMNVVVCVNWNDYTLEIVKTDSVYTRLSRIEPMVDDMDISVNLMVGDAFSHFGGSRGYYTFDSSNKKVYQDDAGLKYIEIPIYASLKSIRLSGFTYTPEPSPGLYTRILFFDEEDNLLSYRDTINDAAHNAMYLEMPYGATQCYVDVPSAHVDDVVVQINGSNTPENFELKTHLAIGDVFDNFDDKSGYYTYDANEKKQYGDNRDLRYIEIPVDTSLTSVKLSGFTYTPSKSGPSVYTRIIYYDSQDNLLAYVAEFTDSVNGEMFLKKPANATQCYVDVPAIHKSEIVVQINSAPSSGQSDSDSYSKYIPNVANLAYTRGSYPLVLVHFSDIHGSGENYERLNMFAEKMGGYINDVISTGDNVYNSWSDSFTYWTNETMLNVIGNHDTAKYESGYDWTYYAGKDAYDRYFAPFISNWGVVQPIDAATNGYCYYYKDYATQGIRLIVLDCMGWDATQLSWLVSTLSSASLGGLSVVIAIHYQFDGAGVTPLETGFNSYVGWSTGTDTYTPSDAISAVDDFITGGGKFICWIAGHTHRDYAGYLAGHNNQLCIVVGTDASDSDNLVYADSARIKGTDSQDLFNVIAFDATEHQIRIVRVGSNFSKQLQPRNTLCIGYSEDGSAAPRVINQS